MQAQRSRIERALQDAESHIGLAQLRGLLGDVTKSASCRLLGVRESAIWASMQPMWDVWHVALLGAPMPA